MAETTALGAAMAAGSASGIDIWDISDLQASPSDTFQPKITQQGNRNLLEQLKR